MALRVPPSTALSSSYINAPLILLSTDPLSFCAPLLLIKFWNFWLRFLAWKFECLDSDSSLSPLVFLSTTHLFAGPRVSCALCMELLRFDYKLSLKPAAVGKLCLFVEGGWDGMLEGFCLEIDWEGVWFDVMMLFSLSADRLSWESLYRGRAES